MGRIKVEFGGFIGGFGKIFFTRGGIKRKGMGFWRDGGIYIFLKIFKEVEKSSKLYGWMYFWVMGWGEKEKGEVNVKFGGRYLGWVGDGMWYGIFLNGMFPIKCNSRITFYGRRLGKFHPSADSSNCKVRWRELCAPPQVVRRMVGWTPAAGWTAIQNGVDLSFQSKRRG